MTQKMFGWEMDRNVEDFFQVSKNMREEGHHSRADVIDYLIARVMIAEERIRRISKLHDIRAQVADEIIAIQNGEDFDKNQLSKSLVNYAETIKARSK